MSESRNPLKRESSRPAVLAQQSNHATKLAVVMGTGVGLVFGFLLEKSKVFVPQVIRDQMALKSFTMMQVFLAASATGSLSAYFLKWLGMKEKRVSASQALGFGVMGGFGGNIVGGSLMGISLAWIGACPGTAAAQVGAGVTTGIAVVLGGVAGAFAFAHLRGYALTVKPNFHQRGESGHVDESLGRSQLEAALVFSSAIAGAIYLIDSYYPWREGLTIVFKDASKAVTDLSLTSDAWHPALAGALVGLLQLPSFIFLDRYLGASSCYVSAACALESAVRGKDASVDVPYYRSFFTFTDWAQAGSVVGIALGAFLSAHLSAGRVALAVQPLTLSTFPTVFAGGFILLFGARMAGGCASGHGLSGMASFSTASIFTVASMFASGILFAGLTR